MKVCVSLVSRYLLVKIYFQFSFEILMILMKKSFPDSATGKEATCNEGDLCLIPGSGSHWRRDRLSLQCSWASLVAQMAKNLLAMQETWVRSLGWEDPLEKAVATHSSILA